MSDEGISEAEMTRLMSSVMIPWRTIGVDEYDDLIARLDAAERERDALREALQGMVRGCDYSHFSDAQLAAEAERYTSDWIDLIIDARAALTANHSAPVVEE